MISFLSSFHEGLHLEKWHGARNDFLFVETSALPSALRDFTTDQHINSFASELCHRMTGLGADGLVLWEINQNQELCAGIWNSDGSRAGTCGNALRCLAALVLEHQIWNGKTPLPVFELHCDGKKFSRGDAFATLLESAADGQSHVSFQSQVAMGRVLEHRKISLSELLRAMTMGATVAQELLLSGLDSISFVKLANPHLVLALKPMTFHKFNHEHFNELGVLLQGDALCRKLNIPLSNIGFVELRNDLTDLPGKPLNAIVFERGAGLTQCCGSGGCAMKVALEGNKNSQAGQPESFAMPGGVIRIQIEGDHLQLSGPAQRVCRMTLL